MRLPDFEAWAIFAMVADKRSFTAAADTLQLSKATVSKAITRLEQHIGTPLFYRTSRRLALTESGQALVEHARQILQMGEVAEDAAREDASAPNGQVRITAPMSFGLSNVAPLVAEFMTLYPGISIDLHLGDAQIDLIGESFDLALRIARLADSSLLARKLRPVKMHVVAAPAYLEQHGTPRHPVELGEHNVFIYSLVTDTVAWRFQGPGGQEALFQPCGNLRVNNGNAMLPAIRKGLGIAMLPDFILEQDLALGTLVPILEQWSPPPIALHLVTPPGGLRPKRVELLVQFLMKHLA